MYTLMFLHLCVFMCGWKCGLLNWMVGEKAFVIVNKNRHTVFNGGWCMLR